MSLKTFILSGMREVLEDKFGYCPGGKDTLIPPCPPNNEQQVCTLPFQGVNAHQRQRCSTDGSCWQYQGSQIYVGNSSQKVQLEQEGNRVYPTLPTSDNYNPRLEEYSTQDQHTGTRIYPALPPKGNYAINCPYPTQPAIKLPLNTGYNSSTGLSQDGVLYFEQRGFWMSGTPGTPSILPVPNFNATEDAEKLRKVLNGNDKSEALNILCARTNWQRQEISKAFRSRYGEELIKDLISELNSEYENVILALMEPTAVYDAKQLHKAIQGLSTEDSMLIECMTYMTSRSNTQFAQIRKAYKELYHKDLEAELNDKKGEGFQRHLASLCAKGRTERNTYCESEQRAHKTSNTKHHSENIDSNKNDTQSQFTGAEALLSSRTNHTGEIFSESSGSSAQLDKLYKAEELEASLQHKEGSIRDVTNENVNSNSSSSGSFGNTHKSAIKEKLYSETRKRGTSDEKSLQFHGTSNDEEERVKEEKSYAFAGHDSVSDKSAKLQGEANASNSVTEHCMQTASNTQDDRVITQNTSFGGEYQLAVDSSSQHSQYHAETDTTTSTGGYNMQMQTKTSAEEVRVTTEKTSGGGEYQLEADKSSQLSQYHAGTDTTTSTGGYNMQMQTKTSSGEVRVTTEKISGGGEYQLAVDRSSQLSQYHAGTDTTTSTGGYNMQMQTKTSSGEVRVTTEKTSGGGEYQLEADKSSQLSQYHAGTDTTTSTGGYNMQMQTKTSSGEVRVTTEKISGGGEYQLEADKSSQLSQYHAGTDTTTSTGGYNMQMQTKTSSGEVRVTTEKISGGGEYQLEADKSSQLSQYHAGTDTTTSTGGYNMQMQTKTSSGEVRVTTEKISGGGEYQLEADKSSQLSQYHAGTDTTTSTGGYNMQMQTKTSSGEVRVTTEKISGGGEYQLEADKSSQLSQYHAGTDTTTSTGGYNMQMQTKTSSGEVRVTTEKTSGGGEYQLAVDRSSQLSQYHAGTDTTTSTGGYNMQMQTKTSSGEVRVTTEKTSGGGEYQLETDKSSQLSQYHAGTDTTTSTGGYNMQMQTKTSSGEVRVTTEKTSDGGEYQLAVDRSSQLSQYHAGTDTTTSTGGYNMQMQTKTSAGEDLRADVDKQTYGSLHAEHADAAEATKLRNVEIRLTGKEYGNQEFGVKAEDSTSGRERRIVTSHFCVADERRFQPYNSSISHHVTEKFSIISEGGIETDEMLFNEILTTNNFSNLEAMFDKYQKETKQSIEKAIDSQFDGYVRNGLLATVGVVRNRPGYFAKVLHDIIESHGSRDDDLMRLIVSRCEYDMVDIRKQFQDMYKVSLEDMINAKYTGVYKDVFATLVSGNRY